MRLYSMPSSGNSYKPRLPIAPTGRSVERVDREYCSDALAAVRDRGGLPFGKVPALELPDGRVMGESNAILCYLGRDTRFWPAVPFTCVDMLSWTFWERYNHEPVIAVRQALLFYPHRAAVATPERLARLLVQGHEVLAVTKHRLAARDWLVGEAASLGDLCLHAYTHTAGTRGGFDLAAFPAVTGWLSRIADLPGYVGLNG